MGVHDPLLARRQLRVLVTEVDAPAHLVGMVLERSVGDQLVEEDDGAEPHLAGDDLARGKIVLLDVEKRRPRVAHLSMQVVRDDVSHPVAAPDHLERAVSLRDVGEGDPRHGPVRSAPPPA